VKISSLVALSLIPMGLMLGGCAQQPAEPAQQPTITPDQTTEPAEPSIQPTEKNGEWSTFTTTIPDRYEMTTLEEIPSLIGARIPLPTYLPEGCDIKEVHVANVEYGEFAEVLLIISDRDVEHIDNEVECIMALHIKWSPEPFLGGLPPSGVAEQPYRWYFWQSCPEPEEGCYEAQLLVTRDMNMEESRKVKQSVSYVR
jgi:hypothetical protein